MKLKGSAGALKDRIEFRKVLRNWRNSLRKQGEFQQEQQRSSAPMQE